jgi:type VI protein secretion system component VasK
MKSRWLLWGFISVLFFLLLWVSSFVFFGSELQHGELAVLLAIGSLLSILVGWVITKFFTVRKERPESEQPSVELEKKELELDKLRREVAYKNAAAQEKKKKMSKRRPVG